MWIAILTVEIKFRENVKKKKKSLRVYFKEYRKRKKERISNRKETTDFVIGDRKKNRILKCRRIRTRQSKRKKKKNMIL